MKPSVSNIRNRGKYGVIIRPLSIIFVVFLFFNTNTTIICLQGNVEKLLELWKIMRNNNIKPSTLSFTHRIECIAKSSKHNKDELLNTTLRVMFDEVFVLIIYLFFGGKMFTIYCFIYMSIQGISINKLFVDTKWRGDSRETVLEAIRAVRPNFNPSVSKLALNYNNCLVNHLNKTEVGFGL